MAVKISVVVLGCDTDGLVAVLAFWRNILFPYSVKMETACFSRMLVSPSSGLKMEKVCVHKTLVSAYMFTWHHNAEEHHY
jgi:hypothetical protein